MEKSITEKRNMDDESSIDFDCICDICSIITGGYNVFAGHQVNAQCSLSIAAGCFLIKYTIDVERYIDIS